MARYDLAVKTAPTAEPISLAEAKLHLRIDHTDEDALITTLITAARNHVESYTRRTLIDTVYYLYLDEFPSGAILLPRGPLDSVVAISYKDSAGSAQTLTATTDYLPNEEAIPPRIFCAYGKTWPATYDQEQAVTVEYKAGYGTAGSSCPQAIIVAMKMLIAHWYEHRESVVVGATPATVPGAVDALLAPYRIHNEF